MHNDNEASTSQCPKPSWYKHPSKSLETKSNEYEWDTLSKEALTIDVEVDVIHSCSSQPDVADESSVGTDKSNPHIALTNHASTSMANPDLDASEVNLIDSTFLFTRDDSHHIHNLEPTISLSLTYLDLIDWSIQYQHPLSHKIKRKNKRLDGKNHILAVFEPKKVKNKDVSKGENLPEAPGDEILGSLPSYFQDRSLVLIEPMQPINLGIEASPQIIHVAQSLSAEENE